MSIDPAVLTAAFIAREELPPEKGDTGPQGFEGKAGQNGLDGAPGRDGRDGIDGKDGQDGRDGKDGAPGRDGTSMRLGSGAPKADAGNPGDVYLDVESGDLWRL